MSKSVGRRFGRSIWRRRYSGTTEKEMRERQQEKEIDRQTQQSTHTHTHKQRGRKYLLASASCSGGVLYVGV